MVAINRVFKTIKSAERWYGKKYVTFKENSKLCKQYNIRKMSGYENNKILSLLW